MARLLDLHGSFDTRDLLEEITRKRFDNVPHLWRVLPGNSRHIRLAPLDREQIIRRQPCPVRTGGNLALQFSFRNKDSLSEDDIRQLTDRLPNIFNDIRVPVADIKWLGFRKHNSTGTKLLNRNRPRDIVRAQTWPTERTPTGPKCGKVTIETMNNNLILNIEASGDRRLLSRAQTALATTMRDPLLWLLLLHVILHIIWVETRLLFLPNPLWRI